MSLHYFIGMKETLTQNREENKMTVNIKRLDRDERRRLNSFLQYFVINIIRRHTPAGKEFLEMKNLKARHWEVPKNLEVSEVDLLNPIWKYWEGHGDDAKLLETDDDLARKFQKEYDDYKRFHKAKSVKFR